MLQKYLIIITAFIFGSCALSTTKECIKVRGALDIGSGSTKIKVAKVNVCSKKIITILMEDSLPVMYADDLRNSDKFSNTILQNGTAVIKKLLEKAFEFKPDRVTGVATAAFRKAKNSKIFLDELYKKFNFKVLIANHKLEAELGYLGVQSKVDDKNIVVWDIGGGSMQITSKVDNRYSYYLDKLASVKFKDIVIEDIQGSNLKEKISPNPISKKEMESSINYSKKYSKKVPELLRSQIGQLKKVYGIGGVHRYSILNQLKSTKNTYSIKELISTVHTSIDKTDAQINSKYYKTEITNLALVLGFMQGLGINQVIVLKINLTDALLLN